MAQRNLFPGSQMPTTDHDQTWNHPPPDHHLPLGNGSYMLPMDNNVGSSAVLRPIGYPSTNFPNYPTATSGSSQDPFVHHPPAASSRHFPPDPYQCMPPPGSSMMHPQDIGRSTFKRKSPAIPLAYHGVNDNGFYNAGSSSNPLQPKPTIMHQYGPLDPATITHSHGSGNLLNNGESAQRNVRSRHINPHVNYSSSSMTCHFHAEGHLIHVPTMPMAPQGDPRFNYEGNQSVVGPSIMNNSIINNGAFYPNSSQSRNTSSLPTIHDPATRGVGTNNNGFNTRSNPYWASSSQAPVGFATTSLESGGFQGMESSAFSRQSRPLSIMGRSSYRNGRSRSSNSRFHGGYVEDGTRSSRWSSEGAVMMDRSTLYDSRNWFDQHRDMRLDIDNMSYEELLALGERIGNVNTGLSDEAISGCLEEATYCSSSNIEEDQEEEKCVICLEEYKDQDKLAKLRCRHDFHACCIKNWLEIKNACPICKAAAFNDTAKGKQS